MAHLLRKTQLIIPLSGVGQRFIDAGFDLPKPFIEIGKKRIINFVIDMHPNVDKILFIVNKDHCELALLNVEEELKMSAGDIPFDIVKISPHKLGPGWAILQAENYVDLDAKIVVSYCDFACTWNFTSFLEELENVDGLLATYTGFHPHMITNTKYAYVRKDFNGFVNEVQEKKSFTDFPMAEEASSGTYGFKSGRILLDSLRNQVAANDSYDKEFYISLTFKNMIIRNLKIKTFPIEQFLQWGTPEDFLEFRRWLEYFRNVYSDTKVRISGVDNIKLLAAGEGLRFQTAGYELPKALLPVSDSLLIENAYETLGAKVSNVEFVVRDNVASNTELVSYTSTNAIKLNVLRNLTKGQAETALLSIGSNSHGNCIFATCDSFLYPQKADFSKFIGKQIGAWIIPPSNFAKLNPNQFGWVRLDSEQKIVSIKVKAAPTEFENWYVICGTFVVGDLPETKKLLIEFLNSNEIINGEYYLDSFLKFAKQNKWDVIGILPENFISLGTPNEYETFNYWRKYFQDNLVRYI